MKKVDELSEFQSHPGSLIAFLNDSAHYFHVYGSPLHAALPCPGLGLPTPPRRQPPAALARSWHVFSKALEPESEIKSQLSGQSALLSIGRSRGVTLATLGGEGVACTVC